jgi:hypothetical protein
MHQVVTLAVAEVIFQVHKVQHLWVLVTIPAVNLAVAPVLLAHLAVALLVLVVEALTVVVLLTVVVRRVVALAVTQAQVVIMTVTVLATWVVSPVAGIKVVWLAKRKNLLNVNQTPLVA